MTRTKICIVFLVSYLGGLREGSRVYAPCSKRAVAIRRDEGNCLHLWAKREYRGTACSTDTCGIIWLPGLNGLS